jgi:hypothetical protein
MIAAVALCRMRSGAEKSATGSVAAYAGFRMRRPFRTAPMTLYLTRSW